MPLDHKRPAVFAGPAEGLDKLIDWKMGSPRSVYNTLGGHTPTKEQRMQRQFTIELRVDYADPEKNAAIKTTLQQCARRAFATANLLADNPKATQVAIFSDDFFSGHEEIALLEDVLGEVNDDNVNSDEVTGGAVSSELMGALKDGV